MRPGGHVQGSQGRVSKLVRPIMPELDFLRGIACLSVLFYHGLSWRYGWEHFSRPASWFMRATVPGWLGVNLFFVLSGFLITGILLESQTAPDYYRRFYIRRALRILPACYGFLLVLWILGTPGSFIALSFLYLANMTHFFGVPMAYGPLWSLAVEEHYYILWPTLVRKLSMKSVALIATGIIVLEPIARGLAFHSGHGEGIDWYTWFVADGLAAGSLLAVVLRTSITRRQTVLLCSSLLGVTAVAAIAGAPFGLLTRQHFLGAALQYTFAHTFFSGILLLFLLIGTSAYRGIVNIRVFRFFGYISYGLYLIHFLIFRIYDKLCNRYWPGWAASEGHFGRVMLRFAIVALVATGVAYVSRKYYEDRFLTLKDRFTPSREKKVADRELATQPEPAAP